MAGQMDEDVNPVLMHQIDYLRIVQDMDRAPPIGELPQPFRGGIHFLVIRIADDLEISPAMRGKQGFEKMRYRMVQKVFRNVADPQTTLRATVIIVGLDGCCQGFRMPFGPL